MRSIKFRIGWYMLKDIKGEREEREWIFKIYTLEELIGGILANECGECIKVIDEYTGLKDCNGKEIYKNDIVKTIDGNIGKVFNEKGCWFAGGINPLGYYKVEVIGNIYSNPELLK